VPTIIADRRLFGAVYSFLSIERKKVPNFFIWLEAVREPGKVFLDTSNSGFCYGTPYKW
jgi:hypothetical protein